MTENITDDALLDRFIARRDEAAFADLVRRHGPMVRATCRRVLGERPDVDDAFQAVFVILARKAQSVRKHSHLGPWLHTIAFRTAHKLRNAIAQRSVRERQVYAMEQSQTSCESNEADWLVWLDEELQSLPSTLRDALVMCEMEDLSRAEAAKRLRIPEGTLSSRLARGKAMLRDRLRRRGVLLSFAALGLAMSSSTQAEASGSLIQNTVQAAVGAGASAPVAALAEGVISTMFLQKLLVGAVVIVFGLVGATGLIGTTGLWIGSRALAAQDQLELARRAELNQNKATKDEDALQGEWEVISVGKVGKKIENDEEAKIKRKTFVFKGDKFISAGEAKFTLDPSKTPKEMDIVPAEGPEGEKGKTFRAIYELKGNDLKITFNGPDQARPKAFDDDGAVAMVLKRSKDKK